MYQKPVISLAILGDERVNWRPDSYNYTIAGCEVSLKFPTVKLLDYEESWSELEASSNPFATETLNPVIKLYIDKHNTPITSNFKLNRQSSGTSVHS